MKPFSGKTVLFDLDGTLIDHFRIIYRCYCYALDKMGLPPVSFEKVKASVGGSIVVTFGKLVEQRHVEEAVGHFRTHFDEIWHEDIEILPGVESLLRELHRLGYQSAVLTNKEGRRSRDIIDLIGLKPYLAEVFGTLDTPYRKPEVEFTRHALAVLGAEPSDACVVGDSPYDIATGHNLGIPVYAVATGSHSLQELRADERVAAAFEDMPALAKAVIGLDL